MSQSLKCTVAALAVGLPLFAYPAQAAPVLPVSNLTFSVFTGVAPKNNFSAVNPTGWACGGVNCGTPNDLVFLDNSVAQAESFTGGYGVYSLLTPPVPGNFVQADGNPDFDSVFYQSISGLTIGQTYELQFWQAAGQQNGFVGDTTEQWIVSLGTSVLGVSCPPHPPAVTCTYSNADGSASIFASTLMNTPSGGNSAWNEVTLFLTADATTDIVSFLAWGDNGSTANLPPTLFLAGVNTPSNVPEPASLSLFGAGLFGVGGLAVFRRRAKRKAVA